MASDSAVSTRWGDISDDYEEDTMNDSTVEPGQKDGASSNPAEIVFGNPKTYPPYGPAWSVYELPAGVAMTDKVRGVLLKFGAERKGRGRTRMIHIPTALKENFDDKVHSVASAKQELAEQPEDDVRVAAIEGSAFNSDLGQARTATTPEGSQLEKPAPKGGRHRKQESRSGHSRRDESRRDESRRDESRRDESRRDESRRDESRRDESRRDESRRDESRRDEQAIPKRAAATLQRVVYDVPKPEIGLEPRIVREKTAALKGRPRGEFRGTIVEVRCSSASCGIDYFVVNTKKYRYEFHLVCGKFRTINPGTPLDDRSGEPDGLVYVAKFD